MRTYSYRGFDASGAGRTGLIEARDAKEARERLATRGVLPQDVVPAEERRGRMGMPRVDRLRIPARVAFYRELGVLLGAGLPLVHAVEILMESPELGIPVARLATVRDRIREGSSLMLALAAVVPDLKAYEQAILDVGERTGSLDTVLERLAQFLEEQERLREKIVSALIYPLIILVFALVVAVGLLGFVVPAAASVITEQAGMTMPLLTRGMMAAGRVLKVLLPLVMLAGFGGWIGWRRRWAHDPEWRIRVDQRLFRLPLVGRGYRLAANLRFSRTLAILLQGGVGLVEALVLAGRATGSAWIAGAMEVQAETVKQGSSLADALRRIPPLASSLPAWVQAGEASGALERLLETAGNTYQHQWDRTVARTLGWLEPVLIIALGLFVLLVTLSVLLPIMSLNQMLG